MWEILQTWIIFRLLHVQFYSAVAELPVTLSTIGDVMIKRMLAVTSVGYH